MTPSPSIYIFILSTLSFVIAFLWTPALTSILYKYRLGKRIRHEDEAPIVSQLHANKAGTPTMGGILIWVTVGFFTVGFYLLAKLFPNSFVAGFNFLTRSETLLPLGALIASAIVGFVDDLFNVKQIGTKSGGLRVRHRLVIYLIIACVGAWWFFIKLQWTTIHVPFVGNFDIGAWYIPLFIVAIIGTAFSVNETDGLDGLAGGVMLIAFSVFGAIAFMQGKHDLAAFCGVIIGALLAFLWFNVPPARFFMGDTGAMSLGITLGIVAMLTNSVLLLPIIGFILVLESLSVIIQVTAKKIFKRKFFLSAPIHHHFEAIGWCESKIVMRFWIIAAVSASVGLIIAIMDFTRAYGS